MLANGVQMAPISMMVPVQKDAFPEKRLFRVAGKTGQLQGLYFLALQYPDIILTQQATGEHVATFHIPFLRSYGQENGVFIFEAGRRCALGPGRFGFAVQDPSDNIFAALDADIAKSRAPVTPVTPAAVPVSPASPMQLMSMMNMMSPQMLQQMMALQLQQQAAGLAMPSTAWPGMSPGMTPAGFQPMVPGFAATPMMPGMAPVPIIAEDPQNVKLQPMPTTAATTSATSVLLAVPNPPEVDTADTESSRTRSEIGSPLPRLVEEEESGTGGAASTTEDSQSGSKKRTPTVRRATKRIEERGHSTASDLGDQYLQMVSQKESSANPGLAQAPALTADTRKNSTLDVEINRLLADLEVSEIPEEDATQTVSPGAFVLQTGEQTTTGHKGRTSGDASSSKARRTSSSSVSGTTQPTKRDSKGSKDSGFDTSSGTKQRRVSTDSVSSLGGRSSTSADYRGRNPSYRISTQGPLATSTGSKTLVTASDVANSKQATTATTTTNATTAANTTAPAAAAAAGEPIKAKALYSNQAEAECELSFRKHNVLTVLEKSFRGNADWWYCELNGKQGAVPANYVKLL